MGVIAEVTIQPACPVCGGHATKLVSEMNDKPFGLIVEDDQPLGQTVYQCECGQWFTQPAKSADAQA